MTVPHSPNGTKPSRHGAILPHPALAADVDDLHQLRGLIRQAQDQERALAAEVLTAMEVLGAERLEGQTAVAVLGERTSLTVDPELFHRALGSRAWAALTVRVEGRSPAPGCRRPVVVGRGVVRSNRAWRPGARLARRARS